LRRAFLAAAFAVLPFATSAAPPSAAQNPSPMVEHTRPHPRLTEERLPGTRIPLKGGSLFLPKTLPPGKAPLFIHFHGATWIPEVAAAKLPAAMIAVQLGSGSAAYSKPFADPQAFAQLLGEAAEKAGRELDLRGLIAWSAGYGAVREILTVPDNYERVPSILLLDGLHCGYANGKPGPLESKLVTEDLAIFVKFAKDAAAGRKRFLLTHTEIFPGTFASTTETADHVLKELDVSRRPVLRWGPMQTQILCEVERGGFRLLGFAGNSAPDHVDLLHSLPDLLSDFEQKQERAPAAESRR
jgi:hypothetical protein